SPARVRWSRALDGDAGHAAPLGPGSVVDPDPVAAEQVGEHEPGGSGAPADGAVGDQLPASVQDHRCEHIAQLRSTAERPIVAVDAVNRLVQGRRQVPGAAAWLHAAGRPETLAPVLSHRAHIDQGGSRLADSLADRGPVRPDARILRTETKAATEAGRRRFARGRGPREAPGPPGIA